MLDYRPKIVKVRKVVKPLYAPAPIYNSDDGLTFQHRGFNMQVIIPDESKSHVDERLATLCPTAALILK